MQRRLIAFMVLIALLFGSVAAPALAHSGSDASFHPNEVIDVHDIEVSDEASTLKLDPSGQEKGSPSSPAAHHHCMCAAAIEDYTPGAAMFPVSQLFSSIRIAVLTSTLSAPPTQPPSA